MNRREFLKNSFMIGGLAALTSLGMGAVEDAIGWGIIPPVAMGGAGGGGGGGAGGSYAAWDQTSETGLDNTQGSGGEDTFVAMAEGGAAANETGVGVMSGADLVLTQNGAIAGVSGGYRQLVRASNQWFDLTENFADNMLVGSTWSIISKWKDITDPPNHHGFFNFGNGGGTRDHKVCCDSTGKAWGIFSDGTDYDYSTTTNAIPNSGVLYVFAGTDGSNLYWGFTTSGSGEGGQPTEWADFAAGDRITVAGGFNNFSVGDFPDYQNIGSYQDAAYEINGYFGWVIVSTEFLLTV